MANITLGHYELKNLRKGLAVMYEQTGQRLEYKKSRTQYMGLCRCIKDSNKKHEHKASISEDQLMSLFMDEQKTTFKNDFIDSCYIYAYGHTQEAYKNMNQDQFNDWAGLEKKVSIEENTETSEAFEDELQKARDIIIRQKKWINYAQKAAIVVASCCIMGSCAYFFYQKYYAKIVWTVSMPWEGETSSRAEMVRNIATDLDSITFKETGRHFELQIYTDARLPNSKGKGVSPLSDLFFAVQRNDIQMAHFSPYYLDSTDLSAAMFFGSIPGGMDGFAIKNWMKYGKGEELREKLYEKYHVKAVTCGETGPQMGGWFKKEIKDTLGFKDLRFRIGSPIGKAVLRSFKADIANTAIAEGKITRLLAIDNLDGAEWICAYDDYNLGLAGLRGFDFYYDSHWHEPALLNDMLINETAFNSLSKDIQNILTRVIKTRGDDLVEILHQKDINGQEVYQNKIKAKGIHVIPFPPKVEVALRQRAKEKVYEFVKTSQKKLLLHEIYVSYQTYCKAKAPTCDCAQWQSWKEIVK